MRLFSLIWFGQLISRIGSEAVAFAVGVWLFQTTGTTLDFTLILLFNSLPTCLAAPFVGALVDRLPRRRLTIIADTGNALCSLLLLVLVWQARLSPSLLYLLVLAGATMRALQAPAWQALTAEVVAHHDLPRATGLNQLAGALALVVGPILGAFLPVWVGLQGVVLLDVLSFLVAVALLLRLSLAHAVAQGDVAEQRGGLSHLAAGLRWLGPRPALRLLLFFFFWVNLFGAMSTALYTPYLLAFTDVSGLGWVSAGCGLGMIGGSVWVVVRNGFRDKVRAMLFLLAVNGTAAMLIGRFPVLWLVAAAAFTASFSFAALNASVYAIWLQQVPSELQGRVFAVAGAVAAAAMPLAYLVSGHVVDTVLNPWVAGLRGTSWWLGFGAARGIGLMWQLSGVMLLVLAGTGFRSRQLRQAEKPAGDRSASSASSLLEEVV